MINLTPLCEMAYKYGSDKCPQIHHTYTPVYYDLLKDRKYSIKKVLEMGIGNVKLQRQFISHCVTGASLYMWRDFFPNAQIYGADNDPGTIFHDERIETYLCDETSEEDIKNLIRQTGGDIDLFIDDGSHSSRDQLFLCTILFPLLKRDTMYIIEDIRLPGTLQRGLFRQGYDVYIPDLHRTKHRRVVKDNIIFVVKPKNNHL